VIIYATKAYEPLADEVCGLGGFTRGHIERVEFPDGEHYRRLIEDVAEQLVVLLAGTI
jgi:ribose-phosphate pyrophosphokinase